MFKPGISSIEQLRTISPECSRIIGAHLLLELDKINSTEAIRLRRRIIRSLLLPNTTGKTTCSGRFKEVDKAVATLVKQKYANSLLCLDVGASDGATSVDLYEYLKEIPGLTYLISDLNEFLFIRRGPIWNDVCDDDGNLIQTSIGPFVIPVTTICHMHPLQLINRILFLIAWNFRRKKVKYECLYSMHSPSCTSFVRVPLICEQAQELFHCDPRVKFIRMDLFSPPPLTCQFVRVMNVLNRSKGKRFGFSDEEIFMALRSLIPLIDESAFLLLGRTTPISSAEMQTNATLFIKEGKNMIVSSRFGNGSELERIISEVKI
jgi:hypothetical protein